METDSSLPRSQQPSTSLTWARSIQSSPSHPVCQRSILIISVPQVGSFLYVAPPRPCKSCASPSYVLHARPSHSCALSNAFFHFNAVFVRFLLKKRDEGLGSHPFFYDRLNQGGRVVSSTGRPHFTTKEIPSYSFLLEVRHIPVLVNPN
jgi:hypothetical protein